MSDWIKHLNGLASLESNVGKKVAFESSAEMIDVLEKENNQLKQKVEQLEQRIIDLDEIADTAFKYKHSSGECMRAWHKLEQLRKGVE